MSAGVSESLGGLVKLPASNTYVVGSETARTSQTASLEIVPSYYGLNLIKGRDTSVEASYQVFVGFGFVFNCRNFICSSPHNSGLQSFSRDRLRQTLVAEMMQNVMDSTTLKIHALHPEAKLGLAAFTDKTHGLLVGSEIVRISVDRSATRVTVECQGRVLMEVLLFWLVLVLPRTIVRFCRLGIQAVADHKNDTLLTLQIGQSMPCALFLVVLGSTTKRAQKNVARDEIVPIAGG